jgi:hypothetical protein
MTFLVLMIICGILLNEFVIRPWKRADETLKAILDEELNND